MTFSDLLGSATGYAYESHHGDGGPVSYVSYTSHLTDDVPLITPPALPSTHQYRYVDDVEGLVPPSPLAAYDYHYYQRGEELDEGLLPPPPPPPPVYYEEEVPYHHYHHSPPHHEIHEIHHHHQPHYHHPQPAPHYEAEHSEEEASSHGEQGQKGYSSHKDFDQGDKQHLENDFEAGDFHDQAGYDKAHEDSGGEHDSHNEAEEANEGAKFGKTEYHKKGHKTTGFHNVYHKDEYKKNSEFYDEDHDGGNYDKYGGYDSHHEDAKAGYVKNNRHDAAHDHAGHSSKGEYDKGREQSAHAGHEGAKGEESYRKGHSDYSEGHAHKHSNGYHH